MLWPMAAPGSSMTPYRRRDNRAPSRYPRVLGGSSEMRAIVVVLSLRSLPFRQSGAPGCDNGPTVGGIYPAVHASRRRGFLRGGSQPDRVGGGFLSGARGGAALSQAPLLPEGRPSRSPRGSCQAGRRLHGHELEDLHGEPALALGQEGVPVGQRPGAVDGVRLDDRVAVLVARRRARSVVANRGALPERRPAVGQRRADPAHPVLPGLHLLGGLLGREVLHRRRRATVKQQVLAHGGSSLDAGGTASQPVRPSPVSAPGGAPYLTDERPAGESTAPGRREGPGDRWHAGAGPPREPGGPCSG